MTERGYIDSSLLERFPYPKPYSLLPWRQVEEEPLPDRQWVWAADKQCNIYAVVRIDGRLEGPKGFGLPDKVKLGQIGPPAQWLPLEPSGRPVVQEVSA